MLNTIATMIAESLAITSDDIAEIRNRLLEEQAAGGRVAATTALEHPEGSSTPLPEAAMRAQNSYAKLRQQIEKDAPRVLALVLAADIAKERRDEAEQARDRHEDQQFERLDTGIHPVVRDHFKRLFQHGVHPHNLKQHRQEEVAILADLTRWKAADPRHLDPDNPWRDVLALYASRLVLAADYGVTVKRSARGNPQPPMRHSDPRYYMFGALLPAGSAPAIPVTTPSVPGIAPLTAPGDGVTDDEANVTAAQIGSAEDDYALPAGLSDAVIRELMEAAEEAVAANSEWDHALVSAIGRTPGESHDAIIATVAATEDSPEATPLRYFVAVARQAGIEAAYYAYREATVRRIASELAAAVQDRQPSPRPYSQDRLTSLISMLAHKGRTGEPSDA